PGSAPRGSRPPAWRAALPAAPAPAGRAPARASRTPASGAWGTRWCTAPAEFRGPPPRSRPVEERRPPSYSVTLRCGAGIGRHPSDEIHDLAHTVFQRHLGSPAERAGNASVRAQFHHLTALRSDPHCVLDNAEL